MSIDPNDYANITFEPLISEDSILDDIRAFAEALQRHPKNIAPEIELNQIGVLEYIALFASTQKQEAVLEKVGRAYYKLFCEPHRIKDVKFKWLEIKPPGVVIEVRPMKDFNSMKDFTKKKRK